MDEHENKDFFSDKRSRLGDIFLLSVDSFFIHNTYTIHLLNN